jgi:hypothetical protein
MALGAIRKSAVRAERVCPYAVFLPPDFPRYCAVSCQVREILQRHTDLIEPLPLDEACYVNFNVFQTPVRRPVVASAAAEVKAATLALPGVFTARAKDSFGGIFLLQALATNWTISLPHFLTNLFFEGNKEEMIRVLHSEHEFSDRFIAYMLSRNVRVEEDLVDQLFNSTEKRLARALLLLARYGKKDEPQKILPRVSQETLAEMIGTTRSRVNLFMNKFKKLGFIDNKDGLEINSSRCSLLRNADAETKINQQNHLSRNKATKRAGEARHAGFAAT